MMSIPYINFREIFKVKCLTCISPPGNSLFSIYPIPKNNILDVPVDSSAPLKFVRSGRGAVAHANGAQRVCPSPLSPGSHCSPLQLARPDGSSAIR